MSQLPRFFINKKEIKRKRFLISDPVIVKHMRLVLRMKKGDSLVLFDGEGGEYEATLGFLSKEEAAGIISKEIIQVEPAKPALFLAQALPKAGKLDSIIRMNTELGAQGFVLFDSEYSIVKREDYSAEKVSRFARVAVEALRQSEGKIMPDFYGPMSFSEALDFKADHKLLLHSRNVKNAQNLTEVKSEIKPGEMVLVYIGPEGGFSPSELVEAESKNCSIVYMDLPVLRTETAGVAVAAILLS